MQVNPDAAVVLFSGGQDSTTCLAWALARYRHVECVTIDYGQRHRIELESAARIAQAVGVLQRVIPCDSFRALGGNSLTSDEAVSAGVNAATAFQLPTSLHKPLKGSTQTFACRSMTA